MSRKQSENLRDSVSNGQVPTGDIQKPNDDLFERGGSHCPAEIPSTAVPAPAAIPPNSEVLDVASLRLSSTLDAALGVKKVLMSAPVRKPDKAWFVRVHPDQDYRLQTYVIELKEERGEMYLVDPSLWGSLAGESTFSPRALYTAINRQGVVFIWPIRLPGPDGRVDEWSRTALESAAHAEKAWVRVTASMSLGAYELHEATGQLPDPEWPTTPFAELLAIAFKGRYVRTLDHPVLRKLRGEV